MNKTREQIMNHVDAHGVTVRERINQALTDTLPDIGQIDPVTKRQLNRLVREGYLSKGRGGPFPALKTVYAVAGFDFELDRREHVNRALALAYLDGLAADERQRRTGNANDNVGRTTDLGDCRR